MKAFFQFCLRAVRAFFSSIFSLVLWTFWLALVVLLVVQLYIATAQQLELPGFVLREVESRLAAAGLRATFARTAFDPTGNVLVENVRVSLPAFNEPVLSARAVYVRLNPLMLIVGRVEPREIRLSGATLTMPAMLSPSGRAEEIVQGIDATLEPATRSLAIRQLNVRAAGVMISAGGVVPLPRETKKPAADATAELIAKEFPNLCRQALAWREQLALFEEPTVELQFEPSESGAPSIGITVLARTAQIEKPIAARATNVRLNTRLLLFGETPSSRVEVRADEVLLPDNVVLRGVHAVSFGRLRLRDTDFDLREIAATADSIKVAGVEVRAISAQLYPRPLPRVDMRATASFLGSTLAMRAEADYAARTATVNLQGALAREVLDFVSQRVGTDVRKFFDYDHFWVDRAEAHFGAGWKFETLSTNIRIPVIRAHGITMHDSRAQLELTGTRLYAPEAFARVGNNFARGSYEHDLKTQEYRFLLAGRLRPLDITAWFRPWWPNFFQQFEFPGAPPEANVDVRSSWLGGQKSTVFIFVDAPKTVFRGAAVDHVRTRLFIRPGFYDAFEALLEKGEGAARGRFTYIADPGTLEWQTIDVVADSSLDLDVTEKLLGPIGPKILAPFQLAQPPELKFAGRFSGAAAPGGAHERMRIEARSAGEFRYHYFPLNDVSFVASLNDDEILVENIVATFAGGLAEGRVRVWGQDAERRLGFDFSLRDAALGQVAGGIEEFFSHQEKRAPAPPGKFVQQKANVKLMLSASAEGQYDNPLAFRGSGSAALQGVELGEVALLGALSEVLKFTALRFTEAQANFKIDGPKLVFPEVTLRGSNSVIEAHGEYALDRHLLDFNAKLFPFQESDSLLKSVVGAVLSPLSNVFEVKLTGSLEKPHWALALGSGNHPKPAESGKSPDEKPVLAPLPGTSGQAEPRKP